MKALKILLLITLLTGLYNCASTKKNPAAAVTAQGPSKPNRTMDLSTRMEAQQEALIEKLNLTAKQEPLFRNLSQKYGQEIKALREQNRGDRQAMMTGIKAIQAKKNEAIQALLTPEQFQVYLTEVEQQRAQQRGPRPSSGF